MNDKKIWHAVMSLFLKIRNLSDEEQKKILDDQSYDAETKERVAKMLHVLESTESFFDQPITDKLVTTQDLELNQYIGKRIAGYKITELIARGGMGFVFRGSRPEPVERKVAIKVIHTEAGDELKKWFSLEQQNILKLNHPNIASVYDVGISDEAIPFIVMEEVHGLPITEFCDQNKLSIPARLELFISVCKAIQYCHQRGVIHCDIKSSNVLVRKIEHDYIVKVIDFGLASVAGHAISLEHKQTQFVGTPEYMSPEFSYEDRPIDVRVDVYSLGALLYSLLSGQLPFRREHLVSGQIEDTLANIRNKQVDSFQVLMSRTDAVKINQHADHCGSTVNRVKKYLSSDLNDITLMSLANDPHERYQSTHELLADLHNYQTNKPIAAKSKSGYERAVKFLKRHFLAVSIAALMLIIIGSFMVVLIKQSAEIRYQYEVSEQQRKRALDEQKTADQTIDLMINLFRTGDPFLTQKDGKHVVIEEVLSAGVTEISRDDEIEPAVKNKLMFSIAKVYKNMGMNTAALSVLETIQTTGQMLNNDLTVDVNNQIMDNLSLLSRTEEALEQGQKVQEFIANNEVSEAFVVDSRFILGTALYRANQYQKAIEYFKDVLLFYETDKAKYMDEIIQTNTLIGTAYDVIEEIDQAAHYLRKSHADAVLSYPPEHLLLARSQMNLAMVLYKLNAYKEAVQLAEDSAAITLKKLGEQHAETITNRANLSTIYAKSGLVDQAIKIQQQNMLAAKTFFGDQNTEYIKLLTVLGNLYDSNSQHIKALAIRKELVELIKDISPDDSYLLGVMVFNLARSQVENNLLDEAMSNFKQAMNLFLQTTANDGILLGIVWAERGKAHIYAEEYVAAITAAEQALSIFSNKLDQGNARYLLASLIHQFSKYKQTGEAAALNKIQSLHEQIVANGMNKQAVGLFAERIMRELNPNH